MAGTGLPIPQDGTVQAQLAPLVDANKLSNAKSWLQIAAAGDKLLNEGAEAYKVEQHQQQVGYYADQDVEIARKRAELRDQFDNNPEGFDNAWKAYSDGKFKEAPGWAVPHLRRQLGSEGNAAYSGLLNQKRQSDTQLAQQSWSALADQAGNDVIGAAMSGNLAPAGPNGEVTDPALLKFKGVMESGVTSRFLAPEEADRRIADVTNRATAEVTIKSIGDEYRQNRANGETAGPLALKAAEERILRDPNIGLSEQQRYAYYHKATAEVRALEAERKQDLGQARVAMTDAMYALSRGVRLDPGAIDSIASQLDKAGGQADTAKLRAAAARAENLSAFSKAPLDQQVQQYRSYTQGTGADAPQNVRAAIEEAASATGVPASYLYTTARKESNFNPTAQAGTSSAGGLYQFTDATWRQTLATYGGKYGLGPDTPKSDARANALMAGEFTKANGQALSAAGLPVTDANLYLAHFAGAQGAVKLLQADPNSRAVGVLPGAAAANQSIFYARDGSARSVGQVIGALTRGLDGTARPSVGGPGVDLRQVAGMQSTLDATAKSAWDTMSKDLDSGIRPSAQALKVVTDAASAAGDHNLLETIGARLDRFDTAAAVGRAPVAQGQAALTELERQGEMGALSPGAAAFKKDVESRIAATRNGLEDNAVNYTVGLFPDRFQTPAPLNVADQKAFQAGLSYRSNVVQFAAQNWRVSPRSALYGADLASVQSALEAADPRGKARIYADIVAAIPDEGVRNATLAKLGEKSPQAMVDAYAGALWPREPGIAESIMRGQNAMQADPRNNPTGKDKRNDFDDALDKALPQGAFTAAGRTNATGAWATMRKAVIARYADMTAADPRAGKEFNEARLQQAVTDVTGGVLKHGSGSIIAPRRGMTQQQFDAVMYGFTDADLAGVSTLNGTPITAAYLRQNARLESIGEGRYLVQVGLNPAAPMYAVTGADTEIPSPFILDLTGRAPGRVPRRGTQRPLREALRSQEFPSTE